MQPPVMEPKVARLIGAGMTVVAAAWGLAVPEGAIARGLDLVERLARHDTAAVERVMERAAAALSAARTHARMPDEIADLHVEALPALMERHGALPPLRRSDAASSAAGARDLAAATLGPARAVGDVPAGIDADAAEYILEQLFGALLDPAAGLWPLVHALAAPEAEAARLSETAEPAADTGEVGLPVTLDDPNVPPLIAGLARATGLPAPALVEIGRRMGGAGTETPQFAARLTQKAHRAGELITRLKLIGPAEPEASAAASAAAEALRTGHFTGADNALARIEDHHLQRAQQDLATCRPHMRAAADARGARGELAEIVADDARAARHYATALRCLPKNEGIARFEMLSRQGNALVRCADASEDPSLLAKAAVIFAEASSQVDQEASPREWARSKVTLGALLARLGEQEQRPERLAAAVRHLDAAASCLAREQTRNEWAQALLQLGRALRRLGRLSGDAAALRDAVTTHRAALANFARDRAPLAWAEAASELGQSLAALGDLEDSRDLADEASAHLEAALAGLSDAPHTDRAQAFVALARTSMRLGRDDPTAQDRAVAASEAALAAIEAGAADDPWSARNRNAFLHQHGVVLLGVAERTGDEATLAAATATLDRARAAFAAAGELSALARLEVDLARIETARKTLHVAPEPQAPLVAEPVVAPAAEPVSTSTPPPLPPPLPVSPPPLPALRPPPLPQPAAT